jgi:hypothetical protein
VSQCNKLAAEKIGSGREQFKARNAFVAEMIGQDPDAYTDGPAIALWGAYDAFAQTVPTTLAGLVAMLTVAEEICEEESEAFREEPAVMISTLATAAKSLLKGVLV